MEKCTKTHGKGSQKGIDLTIEDKQILC